MTVATTILPQYHYSQMTLETSISFFQELGKVIRSGQVNVGRHFYALPLAHAVKEAIHCGYEEIVAIELGVASGRGLLDLCQAAHILQSLTGIKIKVIGMDNATSLPDLVDYRDHPEIWDRGRYKMDDEDALRKKLPDFAELIIGDIGDTVKLLPEKIGNAKIGFVAVDVDFYSSTKKALPIFQFSADKYLPAVLVYFDDVEQHLTYNDWCGEEAAINEFNQENKMRKISKKTEFYIPRFYACHILDHAIRQGTEKPRIRLVLNAF